MKLRHRTPVLVFGVESSTPRGGVYDSENRTMSSTPEGVRKIP